MWWGLLGIGVAALFYFLSAGKKSSGADTVTVPYLVPSTMASPTASTSLSNQPNIIGNSPNSTIPNFTNPGGNPFEAPGTWGTMPNLQVGMPVGAKNNTQTGFWTRSGGGWTFNPTDPNNPTPVMQGADLPFMRIGTQSQ